MNNTGTVIGKGICIRGEISGSEDFFLDGMIEGIITLDQKRLTVGPNGLAQAEIVTGDLVVFGRVEGSVKASSRIELKRNSSLSGDLVATRLSIEDSATMHGFVDLTQPLPAPKKLPVAEEAIMIEEFENAEPQYSEAV